MTTTLTAAASRFFGKRPGTTVQDFANELKALTAEERTELAELLSTELGVTVEPIPSAS